MFKAGIIIFFGIHLVPLIGKLRFFLKKELGENFYMSLFSLVSLSGFLLIIFGYESNSNFLYSVNSSAFLYKNYIMFMAFTLLIAAYMPTYIKKTIKHPMSFGIATWASLHLMVNPDISSIILFGSFLTFSVFSVLVSELRESETNEVNPKITFDILSIALGFLFTFLTFNYHHYFTGVSLG